MRLRLFSQEETAVPKTFLFHKTNPQGQAFELDGELAKRLEAEGWVDSPDKLGEHASADPEVRHDVETQSGKAIPRHTPVNLTTGSGSELGKQPINTGPVSILASDEAKERFGKLWDPDGVPLYGALSPEELGRVVDAMSVDEIKQAIEFAGLGTNELGPEQWTAMLRARLAEALQPGWGDEKDDEDEVDLAPNRSTVDEAVARGKAQGEQTIPPTTTDAQPEVAGNQPGGDGTTQDPGGGVIKTEDMVETGNAKPVERAVDTATPEGRQAAADRQANQPEPAKGGSLPVETVDAMDEHAREDWLTHDATNKDHLRAILTAKGKTPKARDGKEEMQEAIRLAYAPE